MGSFKGLWRWFKAGLELNHMLVSTIGSPSGGCLCNKSLTIRVYSRAPDVWKLPYVGASILTNSMGPTFLIALYKAFPMGR